MKWICGGIGVIIWFSALLDSASAKTVIHQVIICLKYIHGSLWLIAAVIIEVIQPPTDESGKKSETLTKTLGDWKSAITRR